jgi:hypothetical protein
MSEVAISKQIVLAKHRREVSFHTFNADGDWTGPIKDRNVTGDSA